jgi:hypothetical protein
MWQRTTWLGLALVAAAGLSLVPAGAADNKEEKRPGLCDLSLEVAALQTLHEFKFTPAQMERLQKLTRETAEKPRKRKAGKASADFRTALDALRAALVEDSDDDQIDSLEEQIDGLRDSEGPDLDDGVDITTAARKRAPEVLRRLHVRQVASFVAANADEIIDPVERLIEALTLARKKKADAWKEYRAGLAEEIGWLVAGLDEKKSQPVGAQVAVLLGKARRLAAEEFKKQQPALEKEARKIAGGVNPTAVLRHTAEHALAEMLSNPRLAAALKARLK